MSASRKNLDHQLIKDIGSAAAEFEAGDPMSEALRIKTFASPVRMRILVTINITCSENSGISVKQLSDKLGMSHGTTFYHVKQLQKAGFIEEAGTREVNGIVERFYRPIRRLVRISPEVAARMDVPVNVYFEETYQQTRKPKGRRSFFDEDIYVDEKQRDEFLQRFVKLCSEYTEQGEGKMHLGAALVTFEVRDDIDSMQGADDRRSCSGDGK